MSSISNDRYHRTSNAVSCEICAAKQNRYKHQPTHSSPSLVLRILGIAAVIFTALTAPTIATELNCYDFCKSKGYAKGRKITDHSVLETGPYNTCSVYDQYAGSAPVIYLNGEYRGILSQSWYLPDSINYERGRYGTPSNGHSLFSDHLPQNSFHARLAYLRSSHPQACVCYSSLCQIP